MANSSNLPNNPDILVLASLTKRFLPNPLSERTDPVWADLSTEESSVLDQIVSELGYTKDRLHSPSVRTAVLHRISALLSAAVLGGDRGEAAAKRLGSRGDLQPNLYKIRFDDSFKEFEKLGVKKLHVEEVIRDPDSIQHLSAPKENPADFPALSLVAKRISPKKNPSFIALVEAERQANELLIRAVWRLPEHIATKAEAVLSESGKAEITLLDILRMFAAEFGLLFSIGDRLPTRFVYYDVFPILSDDMNRLLQVQNPMNASFQVNLMFRVSALRTAQVAIGYVIDTDAYRAKVRLGT